MITRTHSSSKSTSSAIDSASTPAGKVGGVGSTVGAEGFSRRVAIKRVLPGFSDNAAFARMFVARLEALVYAWIEQENRYD